VRELAAQLGPAARVGLDEDPNVVGHLKSSMTLAALSSPPSTPRAGVGSEVDVDARNPESLGGVVEFRLHALHGLPAEVVFRRAEIDEISQWMTHGPSSRSSLASRKPAATSSLISAVPRPAARW